MGSGSVALMESKGRPSRLILTSSAPMCTQLERRCFSSTWVRRAFSRVRVSGRWGLKLLGKRSTSLRWRYLSCFKMNCKGGDKWVAEEPCDPPSLHHMVEEPIAPPLPMMDLQPYINSGLPKGDAKSGNSLPQASPAAIRNEKLSLLTALQFAR